MSRCKQRTGEGARPRRIGARWLGVFWAIAIALGAGGYARGDDWPTYMHDDARSGRTDESIGAPLVSQWVYAAPARPVPAWPDPQDGHTELPRMRFDEALHVVAVGRSVFFGSSVDNKVHCLDAATGRRRWVFFTGGPVRLAPTVHDGRVYVGSDDGWVYSLDAENGKCLWKFQAAPSNECVLARGKLGSLWPVRTGVVVRDGVAYFGAGVFTDYGEYLYAVNADDGTLIWRFDCKTMGPNDRAFFSPQGYMLLSGQRLFVPSGRLMPYCFDRREGKLIYRTPPQKAKKFKPGGWYWSLVDGLLCGGTQNKLVAYDQQTGKPAKLSWVPARRMIATPEVVYLLRGRPVYKGRPVKTVRPGSHVRAVSRQAYEAKAGKQVGNLKTCTLWRYDHDGLEGMILAGGVIFAGGRNEVVAIDAAGGKRLWAARVRGRAVSLAAARGRLFVSTDAGTIHCFAARRPAKPVPAKLPAEPAAVAGEGPSPFPSVKALVAAAGVDKGYCLIVGDDSGRLALELAGKSDLRIHCLQGDESSTQRLREAMDAAGVYGTKVSVEQGTLDALPYPDYFANLVLIAPGRSPRTEKAARELLRVVKPCGGVLMVGPTGASGAVESWRGAGKMETLESLRSPDGAAWRRLVRGRLSGAADWTHQYGNAGNTGSSADQAVAFPLRVLWYGDPGADKVTDRHRNNPAPLSLNGRVFLQGWDFTRNQHTLMCFDAYNGLMYWQRDMPPGSARTNIRALSGNMACSDMGLFIAGKDKCYRIDPATGRTTATFPLPEQGANGKWAYLAVVGDVLLGSSARGRADAGDGASGRFSNSVFAIDARTGKPLWRHRGTSIRNNTIAVSAGRVFFIDNPAAERPELTPEQVDRARRRGLPPTRDRKESSVRTVVALEIAGGKEAWSRRVDLTGVGSWNSHVLTICDDGVLLICGAYDDSHGQQGDPAKRRMIALSAKDGATLWNKPTRYRTRPVVIAGTIYTDPFAWNLRTGEQKMKGKRAWQRRPRQTHCGTAAGCPGGLFWRNYVTAQYDLRADRAHRFRSTRPGCWINTIPTGGLVVQVEASSGCVCNFALQATFVFAPR